MEARGMKSHASPPDGVGLAPVPYHSPLRNGGGRLLVIQRATVEIGGRLFTFIRKSFAKPIDHDPDSLPHGDHPSLPRSMIVNSHDGENT